MNVRETRENFAAPEREAREDFGARKRVTRESFAALRSGRAALFVVLFAALAVGDARAQDGGSASGVASALTRAFGTSVEAVTRFRPFYLTGDFNHDRAQDVLVVVRLKVRRERLPAGVRVINPFGYGDVRGPNDSSSAPGPGAALALAVIHGGPGGWRTGDAAARFLLAGGSPVLALNHERATSADPADARNLLELVPRADARKRRAYARMKPPAAARGDWVLVPTEAAEALIFWDGKTYRYVEDPEGY